MFSAFDSFLKCGRTSGKATKATMFLNYSAVSSSTLSMHKQSLSLLKFQLLLIVLLSDEISNFPMTMRIIFSVQFASLSVKSVLEVASLFFLFLRSKPMRISSSLRVKNIRNNSEALSSFSRSICGFLSTINFTHCF